MAKLKTITLTISSLSVLSGATHAQAASTETDSPSNKLGMAMMRLNSSLPDQAQTNKRSSGSLWASLRRDFRINEVNTELVHRHESKFIADSGYFDRAINYSKPYMYHIASEVKKRNTPAKITLLPFIESASVTKAKSYVGASGLWQFMSSTGRHYGLEKTALYDRRRDVCTSTNVALNYLEYLHSMFGDWTLALAAYNWGEGNIGRTINRIRTQGLGPTYGSFHLPNETRSYVSKLLAVRNIVSNPQMFGLNINEINNQPYFKSVNADKAIDSSTIARFANISESELLALDPGFGVPIFTPKNNRKLLSSASTIAAFEKNYRNTKPENLLSWDIYSTADNASLSTIAAETGMSVAELKRLNNIGSNSVSADRNILATKNNSSNSRLEQTHTVDIDITFDSYRPSVPRAEQIVRAEKSADLATASSQTITSTIDFVSHSKTGSETHMATSKNNESTARKQGTATSLVAKGIDTQINPNPMIISAASEETSSQPVLSTLLDNGSDNTQTDAIAKLALQANPPATTISLNQTVTEQDDELISLVKNNETDSVAANALIITEAKVTARTDEPATAQQARIEKTAENRIKQKHRIESRLAHAEQETQRVASTTGTHKASDGDTLFNISQRYGLGVADLITANNTKGSNIQKGQVLRIIAPPVKNKTNNIKNVSYTIRKEDTLDTIANQFNLDINDIRRWNRNTHAVPPSQHLSLLGS